MRTIGSCCRRSVRSGVDVVNIKGGVFIMATIKDFWEDERTGKIYAVESTTFGEIIRAAGPFEKHGLKDLEDYDYKPAIVDWLKRAIQEKRLRRMVN